MNILNFMYEYEKLCKKYNLCIEYGGLFMGLAEINQIGESSFQNTLAEIRGDLQ